VQWKSIITAMQAEGYTGAEDDVGAVQAFAKTNNIVIKHQGQTIDLAACAAASQAQRTNMEQANKIQELQDELARVKSRSASAEAMSGVIGAEAAPQTFAIGNAQRKAYDKKAKSGRDFAGRKQTSFATSDEAELFGAWYKSVTMPATLKADERSLLAKANITSNISSGGATVPDIFIPSLIELKELRGAARQVMDVQTVGSDVVQFPRRTGGVTVYWAGEAGSITASDVATNVVQVIANKMTALTYVSNELVNDSAINFGDFVAREHAYAFADKEDEAAFNGDGTSTYGTHTGFRTKLLTDATVANNAGVVVGTGSASYSSLVLADFEAVVGRPPAYVDQANPVWVCHKEFYFNTMAKLALASGGVTSIEIENGMRQQLFLGYPVVFSQVMPRIAAASQICCLFGAFNLAAKATQVGGGMTIASDASVGFASDTTAFRGTNRFGITVHDIGNTSATAASRIPGAVVGLATGA